METLKHQLKMEIRRVLESRGYPFIGDVDTELASSLMEIIKSRRPKKQVGADFFSLAQSLAVVCRMDFIRNQGRLLNEAKQLNVEPSALEAHYGKGKWWYTTDWRGKKGQPPTPLQIRETWGTWGVEEQADMSRFVLTASGRLVAMK